MLLDHFFSPFNTFYQLYITRTDRIDLKYSQGYMF